eukprot:2247562-Rhodomonas_salina.1
MSATLGTRVSRPYTHSVCAILGAVLYHSFKMICNGRHRLSKSIAPHLFLYSDMRRGSERSGFTFVVRTAQTRTRVPGYAGQDRKEHHQAVGTHIEYAFHAAQDNLRGAWPSDLHQGFYCSGSEDSKTACTVPEGFYCPALWKPIFDGQFAARRDSVDPAEEGRPCPPNMYCAGNTSQPVALPLVCDLAQSCGPPLEANATCAVKQSTFD